MLDQQLSKEILAFVATQPRTIQEIAHHVQKNWRTADRYVEQISQETGLLGTRTFRQGTRGALKVVYLVHLERIAGTEFQERLLQRITAGRRKQDFSPFDIYQHVDPKRRNAFLETMEREDVTDQQDLAALLRSAQESLLMFSGNLSWANLRQGRTQIITVLEEIAERGIPVKIIARVDIASIANVEKVLAINARLGRDAIEIRHVEQPLRCFVVDTRHCRLKETKDPSSYKPGELAEKTFIFYDLHDPDWVLWVQKVFWKMFSTGIPAAKRLETMESIRNIRRLSR